jgi:hypothetical protein
MAFFQILCFKEQIIEVIKGTRQLNEYMFYCKKKTKQL